MELFKNTVQKVMAGAMLTLGLGLGAAQAADYPNKPIQVILPFAAGGPTDVVGRVIATQMGEDLEQPFIIESRPGASGTLGSSQVSRAKPDGYTLLMNASVQVIYPGMFKELNFDPMGDFVPIGVLGTVPMVAVVPNESPYQSLKEIIDLAKEDHDAIAYASPGIATLPHLVGELILLETDAKMTHVGYRGTGPALTDIAGGHIDLFYAPLAPALPLIESGAIRPLAVTTKERLEELPDVPPIAEELELEDFDVVTWYGMWAPKDTPDEIVELLNKTMRQASQHPRVAETLKIQGTLPSDLDVAETAKMNIAENQKWLQVMSDANIQPE